MRTAGFISYGPALAIVAWVVAMVATIGAAIGVAVTFAVAAVLRGERDRGQLLEAVQTPFATAMSLVATQLVLLVLTLVACRFARREGAGESASCLGLVVPRMNVVEAVILVIATVVPLVVGLLAAAGVTSLLGPAPESGFTRMWSEAPRLEAVTWVLLVALLPGTIEELFYRGFVQQALLQRWRPATAILVTSVLFGIAHLDPAHVAFTFVMGTWFGVVGWRTGAVVLPIMLHALMNGLWTLLQMMQARMELASTAHTAGVVAVVALGVVAFARALLILRRLGAGCSCARSPAQSTGASADSSQASRDSTSSEAPAIPLRMTPGGIAGFALAILLTACGLYAIIPDPVPRTGETPTVAFLQGQVRSVLTGRLTGELSVDLSPGEAARVLLPPNDSAVDEVIIALDGNRDVIWLAYNGDASGKSAGAMPLNGILEQLSNDPTRLCARLEWGGTGDVTARLSLLCDEQSIAAALERARNEANWATRGRRSSP